MIFLPNTKKILLFYRKKEKFINAWFHGNIDSYMYIYPAGRLSLVLLKMIITATMKVCGILSLLTVSRKFNHCFIFGKVKNFPS